MANAYVFTLEETHKLFGEFDECREKNKLDIFLEKYTNLKIKLQEEYDHFINTGICKSGEISGVCEEIRKCNGAIGGVEAEEKKKGVL